MIRILILCCLISGITGVSAQSFSTMKDNRDNQEYKIVTLKDGKTWMAENLNYNIRTWSWWYDNDSINGEKYGRLYNWESVNKVCPPGWRWDKDSYFG